MTLYQFLKNLDSTREISVCLEKFGVIISQTMYVCRLVNELDPDMLELTSSDPTYVTACKYYSFTPDSDEDFPYLVCSSVHDDGRLEFSIYDN